MTDGQPWHETDAFWDTFAPVMFTQARWEAAAGDVDRIEERLGLAPGAAVLDLCCGPGRHALELARRGYVVTGVDRTERYVAQAQAAAREQGLHAEFLQDDMRRFLRPEAFDAATNLFTAFGYFEDPDEDRQVLLNLHASLKPGGALLMDMVGKEWLARVFRERDWREVPDGGIMLEERRVTRNWSWMVNRWILLRGAERKEFTLSHRIYSASELAALLSGCGFAEVNIYGSLAGTAYDHKAERLVAVARK